MAPSLSLIKLFRNFCSLNDSEVLAFCQHSFFLDMAFQIFTIYEIFLTTVLCILVLVVCAKFCENRSRNADAIDCGREERTDRQTDRRKNKFPYNDLII